MAKMKQSISTTGKAMELLHLQRRCPCNLEQPGEGLVISTQILTPKCIHSTKREIRAPRQVPDCAEQHRERQSPNQNYPNTHQQ